MSDIKCPFMNRKAYNDYYCNKVKHNVPYETYIKYCTEYSYDDCPNYTACYISTIVCNELGEKKAINSLKTLKYLRYNILEKNKKYNDILDIYDVVGPIIFNNIIEESKEKKKQIVSNLYNLCIEKVSKLIELKKVDDAIELYKSMTNLLVEGYQIHDNKGKLLLIK